MDRPAPPPGRQHEDGRGGLAGLALPGFILVSLLHLEGVLRLQTGLPFFSLGLVYATLFAALTALVVHLLASFVTGWRRDVVVAACLAGLTLIFISQFIYYDIFGTFYSVFSAGQAGQVTQFAGEVLGRARDNVGWLLLLLLPLAVFLAVRTSRRQPPISWWHRAATAALAAVLFAVGLGGISYGDRSTNSAYDMYFQEFHPVSSVDRLGLVTTMRLDLQRTVLGFERRAAPPPPVLAPPPRDLPASRPTDDATATAYPPDGSEEPSAPRTTQPPGENIMDIDFEQLIAETDSPELANLHRYLSTREPSAKNAHTGRFEGYNLVLITAEGFSHHAVHRDVTPTLYRMTQEGFRFTDFYNPLWGVSTSDGEYVATTGLIPKSGIWSMARSGQNFMPLAMGNQLRKLGYATFAYHNHTYDYYGRDVSHPNLGYDYKGVGHGLQIAPTWPGSDLEMIDITTEEILAEEPFHAYYMTVSGHLEYNFGGNHIAAKNRDVVAHLPYGEAGRAYLATQVELDRALELLLERLEEAGVAERTLIVLSADHYPYGLTHEQIEDLAGHRIDRNFELYRSDLIVYAPGMEPETVDEPVSSLDIIPTVSNLLGLDFDSRLLMGRDVFSGAEPLVIFSDRSFITDQGRYNSTTREFTPAPGAEVPDDYQQRISEEIDRRFYYSAMILDTDYYALVWPE